MSNSISTATDPAALFTALRQLTSAKAEEKNAGAAREKANTAHKAAIAKANSTHEAAMDRASIDAIAAEEAVADALTARYNYGVTTAELKQLGIPVPTGLVDKAHPDTAASAASTATGPGEGKQP